MKLQNVYDHPHNLVYCKPARTYTNQRIIEVYSADGALLNAFVQYDVAFACALHNDLIPVYVN
jgi:hypothetical protein